MFWARQKRADARAAPSPNHLTRGFVKEGPPIGTSYHSNAGPSTHLFPSDPFLDTPVVRVPPEADTACGSNRSVSTLELAPGVIQENRMGLNEQPYQTHEDQVMDGVVQNAFQDPSYLKVGKGVAGGGKGKGKASEIRNVFEVPPSSVEVEPAGGRLTPTGENYSMLDLVSSPLENEPAAPCHADCQPCCLEPPSHRFSVSISSSDPTRPRFKRRVVRPDPHSTQCRTRSCYTQFYVETRQGKYIRWEEEAEGDGKRSLPESEGVDAHYGDPGCPRSTRRG
jgi:hypothetical protein